MQIFPVIMNIIIMDISCFFIKLIFEFCDFRFVNSLFFKKLHI